MKKLMFVAALAAVASAPVMAADAYVFGNVGHTSIDAGAEDFKDAGIGGGVGFKLHPNLGVELGASYLGKDQGVKSDAVSASLVGRYPVAHGLTARAKLGVANTGIYAKQGDAQIGTRGNDVVMGLGAEYALDKRFSLVGEYERFNNVAASKDVVGERLNADRFSVGVQYKF